MNLDTDTLAPESLPVFLNDANLLLRWMQGLSFAEAKKLWRCSDKLAALNFERLRSMELEEELTPALTAYEGIQYQYMAPAVFTQQEWDYVQEHLRILSGFYGVLRPLDGVRPYRLEMQARVEICGDQNLYAFWDSKIYRAVWDRERILLNLASKEYAKCVETYLQPSDIYVTCVFGELAQGRVIQKGTKAKMARGEMVRYLAERQISDLAGVKTFSRLGYRFRPELSTEKEYIFIQEDTVRGNGDEGAA